MNRYLYLSYFSIAIFMIMLPGFSYGESIENVRFEQKGEQIFIYYDLSGAKENYQVSIKLSDDGGNSFKIKPEAIQGDVGDGVAPGTSKIITWSVLEDATHLSGSNFVFLVEAQSFSGDMVFIKGGCFQMGDNFGDGLDHEKPVHEVCVDDYSMDKKEVTQREFSQRMGNNPSHFKGCDNCPVEQVTWFEARDYCQAVGKRLPTEAEWEYAARSGGKREKFAGTNSESALGSFAWYGSNSGSKTHPVGEKSSSGMGLYDMTGNVWEWCSDWYGENYYGSSLRNNPRGPSNGKYRVLRGGSWSDYAGNIRAALWSNDAPGNRYGTYGFRCSQ